MLNETEAGVGGRVAPEGNGPSSPKSGNNRDFERERRQRIAQSDSSCSDLMLYCGCGSKKSKYRITVGDQK
jgi:hypothetical protein